MPIRALRPCNHYGCKKLTASAYCPEHIIIHKPIDYRESARNRGYDRGWDRFAEVYKRQHPICTHCGKIAYVVHHIIPLVDNGSKYDEANLQSLCIECHGRAHSRP